MVPLGIISVVMSYRGVPAPPPAGRAPASCATCVDVARRVPQPSGPLSQAQVPGQERGDLRHSGGEAAGAAAGLQDHHARREQGESHELHRQRAGEAPTSAARAHLSRLLCVCPAARTGTLLCPVWRSVFLPEVFSCLSATGSENRKRSFSGNLVRS